MEFQIKIHPEQRLTRIPKILAKNFGNVWTLVPDTKAAVVFPENEDLETVAKSLDLIQQSLRLQIERLVRAKKEERGQNQPRQNLRQAINPTIVEAGLSQEQ